MSVNEYVSTFVPIGRKYKRNCVTNREVLGEYTRIIVFLIIENPDIWTLIWRGSGDLEREVEETMLHTRCSEENESSDIDTSSGQPVYCL